MVKKKSPVPESFVVVLYAKLFQLLSCLTPFSLLRKIFPWFASPKRSYVVVEMWVIGNCVLAWIAAFVTYRTPGSILATSFLFYGVWRTFEIVVVQTNVLLFDEWRAKKAGKRYSLRGYRRIALLLMHNYAEIVFWFMAMLFTLRETAHVQLTDAGFLATFRASLISMVSFSSGDIKALDLFAFSILAAQSVIGIFMTILTLSRFVSLIPAPTSQDEAEQ